MKHQKEHQLHMYKFRTTVFCQTAEPTNSLSHTGHSVRNVHSEIWHLCVSVIDHARDDALSDSAELFDLLLSSFSAFHFLYL